MIGRDRSTSHVEAHEAIVHAADVHWEQVKEIGRKVDALDNRVKILAEALRQYQATQTDMLSRIQMIERVISSSKLAATPRVFVDDQELGGPAIRVDTVQCDEQTAALIAQHPFALEEIRVLRNVLADIEHYLNHPDPPEQAIAVLKARIAQAHKRGVPTF